MIGYAISSLLWALGGLIVGFLLGRIGQASSAERTEVTEMSDGVPPTKVVTVSTTAHRIRGALTFDRLVAWVIIVLAVGSVITMSYTMNRQQQLVTCQADYNAAFVAALEERTEAAAADRQAQRVFLTGLATAQDQETSQRQFQAYLRALDNADDKRDDSPLPQRPTC